jgi:hypothetical protein
MSSVVSCTITVAVDLSPNSTPHSRDIGSVTAKDNMKNSSISLMVSFVAVSMTEAVLLEGLKLRKSLERVRSPLPSCEMSTEKGVEKSVLATTFTVMVFPSDTVY